jgi:hypothetical protein
LLGLTWGCGSAADSAFIDRDSLNESCDYLLATLYNSDELLQCEVAMTACTDTELYDLVEKWSCELDEPTDYECPRDENGDIQPFIISASESCHEAIHTVAPEDNSIGSLKSAVLSYLDGRLAGTLWCGQGDPKNSCNTDDRMCTAEESRGNVGREDCCRKVTGSIDAGCRRHDQGTYGNQSISILGVTVLSSTVLPDCGVDGDLVSQANASAWYNSSAQDPYGNYASNNHSNNKVIVNLVFGDWWGNPFGCEADNINKRECTGRLWWRECTDNWGRHKVTGSDKTLNDAAEYPSNFARHGMSASSPGNDW